MGLTRRRCVLRAALAVRARRFVPDVPRGDLPERIQAVLALQVEFAHAAGPWLAGELPAPHAQLMALVSRAGALVAACDDLVLESRAVYRLVQAEYERNGG